MPESAIPDSPAGHVFLSYASPDIAVAQAVCAAIESAGRRCWIAPRDVHAGESYAAAIVDAINDCAMLVLLLSRNSADSMHVLREVERASSKKRLVLTVRLDDVTLPRELEYFLSMNQWLDASRAGVDAILPELVAAVRGQHLEPHAAAPTTAVPPVAAPRSGVNRTTVVLAAVVALGAAYVAAQKLWPAGASSTAPAVSSPPATTSASGPAPAPRTAIAVMPFANLTGDAGKDYLGDGMAEELIHVLSSVPALMVPARTSTFSYKGRNADVRQIGRELGVGSIVEGSVRSAGTDIRITAQLIDASSGLHVWSETYDRKFTNLFKLQDDLAKAIVKALQVKLDPAAEQGTIEAAPTRDVEAYRLYLQGTALLDRPNADSVDRAIAYFEQAAARDPGFARAYEGITRCHLFSMGILGRAVLVHAPLAEKAARRAIELDPSSASALGNLAVLNAWRGRRLDSAEQTRAALAANPGDALVHSRAGGLALFVGHLKEGIRESRTAYAMAPGNPFFAASMGSQLATIGQDEEARKFIRMATELGYPPDNFGLLEAERLLALRAGRYAEARELYLRNLRADDPEQARTAEIVRLVHAALADRSQRGAALAARERLYAQSGGKETPAVWGTESSFYGRGCVDGAYAYVLIDAVDVAYGLANQCLDRGVSAVGAATNGLWSPEMRSFRRDPRFQAYVTRLGDLMAYWQKYGPPDDCDLQDGRLTCR